MWRLENQRGVDLLLLARPQSLDPVNQHVLSMTVSDVVRCWIEFPRSIDENQLETSFRCRQGVPVMGKTECLTLRCLQITVRHPK